MTDLKSLMEKIRKEAEEASAEVRWVRTCREGDEIRQGDVYLYSVDTEPEHGERLSTHQLAPGSTRGSRHVVEGDAVLFARDGRTDDVTGPVLHARERVIVTHPEHAHVSLPTGWYEVRYQLDFAASEKARQARRVWD